MWVFLLLTSIVGIFLVEWTATFSIALFWNILNTVVLTVFLGIAIREARRLKRDGRAAVLADTTPAAPALSPTAV